MTLRHFRERVIQTLAYEAGGLLVATPIYAALFGDSAGDSALLLAAIAVAMMLWSPLHNSLFDWLEWRLARRLASDRPHLLRLVHALSHEATALIVTLPLLMTLGGLGLGEALVADVALTLVYTAYAYGFHWVYDRLRPVRPAPSLTKEPQP